MPIQAPAAGLLLFYSRRLYAGLGFSAKNFFMHSYGLDRPQGKPADVAQRLRIRIRNDRHIVTMQYSVDGQTWGANTTAGWRCPATTTTWRTISSACVPRSTPRALVKCASATSGTPRCLDAAPEGTKTRQGQPRRAEDYTTSPDQEINRFPYLMIFLSLSVSRPCLSYHPTACPSFR